MGKFKPRDPPVKEGDVFVAKCEGQGAKGAGIFKQEGFVIFVEKAESGKEYEIKITKVLEKFGFGEIVQIIN